MISILKKPTPKGGFIFNKIIKKKDLNTNSTHSFQTNFKRLLKNKKL